MEVPEVLSMAMDNVMPWLRTLGLVARISGALVSAFLLFFLVGHLLGEEGFGHFATSGEVLLFLCFPVLVILGLLVAFWRPGTGGAIALSGMVAFLVQEPRLWTNGYMLGITFPALAFVLFAVLKRRVTSAR